MNNQKDTQRTGINIYGQPNVSDFKSLPNINISEFANKKTEKLVTALYMVTDCMDTDDALKSKLRLLGVELLSDIYKLSTLSPVEKHTYVSLSLNHIHELLSFIEIAYTIGFISEMNTSILKREFNILATELESKKSKDKHFTFTLNEEMFDLPEASDTEKISDYNVPNSIKDKRTTFNTMSFINKKSPLSSVVNRKIYPKSDLSDKIARKDKIISLIKDKKDISIKDISLAFTDCSEKTIQRELNTLVLNGQLKKTGSKRWSRYSIITN